MVRQTCPEPAEGLTTNCRFIPVRLELVEGPRFGSILVFVYAVARHLKSGWRAAVASSRRETGVV